MTNKQAFDTVCAHLVRQRRRAFDAVENVCRYRTEDGLKCAVGCLIPDTEYTPEMEGRNYHSPTWRRVRLYNIPNVSKELLRDLQSAHDCPHYEAEDLRERLRDIAESHNLDASAVKNIEVWAAI